jgi:hypothetical protein
MSRIYYTVYSYNPCNNDPFYVVLHASYTIQEQSHNEHIDIFIGLTVLKLDQLSTRLQYSRVNTKDV